MAKKRGRKGLSWLKLIFWPFRILIAIVLPFIVLIRVSVFCYTAFELHPWISLLIAAVLTFLLLFYYLTWLYKVFTGKKRAKEGALKFNFRVSLIVVAGFCVWTLLFLSAGNAKTSNVQGEYSSTHPLLRLAVSTLIIFDSDLVITDMSRTHKDYDDMGLKRLNNSLHYPQADGYVHAMDLRTNDRSDLRNDILKTYFWLMGFNTIRHVGTGDHLHISLMIHENPQAK